MSISFLPKSVSREEAFYLEKCCPLLQEAGAVHVGGRSMCWTVDFTKRTDWIHVKALRAAAAAGGGGGEQHAPQCSQNGKNRARIFLKLEKKIVKYFRNKLLFHS